MTTRVREEKYQEALMCQTQKITSKIVVSESTAYCQLKNGRGFSNTSAVLQNFARRNITYKPNTAYEPFSFEVERMLPSFDFFKVKVKIAHFKLTVSAVKLPSLNLLNSQQINQGCFANIYSLNLGHETLCLKSFNFSTKASFQKIFPAVIKQWAILRICEVLECAPCIPHSLGFQLFIYNDCIQYATEMGSEIHEFSTQEAKHLRNQLTLMHSFKIMHLDIKPQNIVFSEHFGKPVFIDFGFSQIIEESIGFKTLIKFKGTPNFCSPQMLAIMLENEGYVDLYYNDINSLDLVLKYVKTVHLNECKQEDSQEETTNTTYSLTQGDTIYALCAFQYFYLEANMYKARKALQCSLAADEKNIIKVLMFVKKVMKFKFLRQIFEKDLNKYSRLSEYIQIQRQQMINSGKNFYKNMVKQTNEIDEQEVNGYSEFNLLSFSGSQLSQSFLHYVGILLNLNQLDSNNATNFVAIAFQCVRFDVRNLQVREKKQIANKMNGLLLKYLHWENMQSKEEEKRQCQQLAADQEALKQIKLLFLLIFEFCLIDNSQNTKWVKKHLFNICQQMILLNTFILQHVDKLQQYTQKYFTHIKEQALVMFQYSRLSNTAKMVESINTENHNVLIQRLAKSASDWILKFRQSSQLLQDKEITGIRRVLSLLQKLTINKTTSRIDVQIAMMEDIQDSDIRKYLLLCLIDYKIHYYFDSMNQQQIFQILDFVKQSSDFRNLDLLSSATITIKLLVGAYNIVEVQSFCKYIDSTINCKTISNSLKLQQRLLRQGPKDNIIIERQIYLMPTKYKNSSKKDATNCQILQILIFINKGKIKLSSQGKENLLKLYDLYQQQCLSRENEQDSKQINEISFVNAYYYIQLEYQFLRFSEQTKYAFLSNLQEISTQFQEQDHNKNVYDKYKKLFYHFYYYAYLQQILLCLQCLAEVRQILRCLNLNFFILETMKMEIQIAANRKNMQLIRNAVSVASARDLPNLRNAVVSLYYFCCQINFKPFYLLQRNNSQAFTTLIVLKTYNSVIFYQFLQDMIMFLADFPIQSYFREFWSLLENYLAYKPQYSNVFHFTHFINNQMNLKSNPYLLVFYAFSLQKENSKNRLEIFKKIALHCDRLSPYAKKKILEKYYAIFLYCLNGRGQSQKIFVFRLNKPYIKEQKRRSTYSYFFNIRNKNEHLQKMLKSKSKLYKQYLL